MSATRILHVLAISALAALALGCGLVNREEPEGPRIAENPFGPTGVPPQLRSRSAAASGAVVTPGGNRAAQAGNLQITPEEDLVFTDPDNPDAGIPELTEILAQPARRGPWEESETVARRRAMRENKPLMIWFTDSARSPMCKALGEELFGTPEFNDWADAHLVRLRIDTNLSNVARDATMTIDDAEALREEVRAYNLGLRKRFRVLGNPSVMMLDAEGRVLTRYRGYRRGEAEVFFGKIRHTESIAAKHNDEWRKNMESRGYREWSDGRGRKTIFARLVQYHEGSLVLVEPDGTRSRTREAHLSAADRTWIEDEKRRRGM